MGPLPEQRRVACCRDMQGQMAAMAREIEAARQQLERARADVQQLQREEAQAAQVPSLLPSSAATRTLLVAHLCTPLARHCVCLLHVQLPVQASADAQSNLTQACGRRR